MPAGDIPAQLSRLHYPVTALGPGRRIGVWFQGCTIGCRGCISRDTWDQSDAPTRRTGDVLAEINTLVDRERPDGLTISGGEPFEQPEALTALIDGVRARHGANNPDFDVLVFSGLTATQLDTRQEILRRIDVVVAGPYVEQRAIDEPLRASSNQELIVRTDVGRRRYATLADDAPRSQIQVVVQDEQIYVIGLPSPGSMDRFSKAMAARGITLSDNSWAP